MVANSWSNFGGNGRSLTLNGGTLKWAASSSFDPTSNGTLTFGGGTPTLDFSLNGNSQIFAGSLNGPGTFTFNSGGSLTLNAASPGFTGGITMPGSGGTLTLGNSNSLQNATLTISNGNPTVDKVQFTGGTDTVGGIITSWSSPFVAGSLTVPSGIPIQRCQRQCELHRDWRRDFRCLPKERSGHAKTCSVEQQQQQLFLWNHDGLRRGFAVRRWQGRSHHQQHQSGRRQLGK